MRARGFKLLAVLTLVLGLLLAPCFPGGAADEAAQNAADDVSLLCLNVGKADCLLLFAEGKTFLIDAGYPYNYGKLQTALYAYGVTRLDGVFLTHPHKDHQGGLSLLAASDMPVDAWYAPALYFDVKPSKHALALAAAARGQEPVWLSAGDVIPISDTAAFHVLGPIALDTDNENNNSLVLHVTTAQGDLLLAGDMKLAEEFTLLKAGVVPKCAVLKAGHHGDGGASGDSFVRAVMPQVAVISTSTAEEPDTPDPDVLARFARYGIQAVVTQDTEDGVLVTLRGGQARAQGIAFGKDAAAAVELTYDAASAAATLTNTGAQAVDLTGYLLYAARGEDALLLPGRTLAPGESLTVGARDAQGTDIRWDVKRLLNQKKADTLSLYDRFGREIARTGNGLSE